MADPSHLPSRIVYSDNIESIGSLGSDADGCLYCETRENGKVPFFTTKYVDTQRDLIY